MAYTDLHNISSNKIFMINRSELDERLDPSVYKSMFNYTSKLFPIVKLSELCFIDPKTNLTKISADAKLSFVPMSAIDENLGTIDFNLTEKKTKKESKGYTVFQEGDLLWAKITPCMQNGKSAIARNLSNGFGFGSTEYFVLRPKTERVLIDYIHILLRNEKVLNSAENYFGGSAGHQRVSVKFLKGFNIPLPSIEIQQEIISKYQNAYNQKQQKEAEAKLLLANIDAYLLDELGITIREKNTGLLNRIYTISFSEFTGGRFDVFYAFNKENNVDGGIFPNKKLREIGVLKKGQSITSERIVDGDYPVIAGGQSSPYSHNQYNFEGDVITVSASGAYSGYVWYHTTPIFASDCTVIKTKDSEVVSTYFLFELLKLKQREIYNLQQGSGQPHVYSKDLAKLNIPTPPLAKQDEIIRHISEIRSKAKNLQDEAKIILKAAKQEIENRLLG